MGLGVGVAATLADQYLARPTAFAFSSSWLSASTCIPRLSKKASVRRDSATVSSPSRRGPVEGQTAAFALQSSFSFWNVSRVLSWIRRESDGPGKGLAGGGLEPLLLCEALVLLLLQRGLCSTTQKRNETGSTASVASRRQACMWSTFSKVLTHRFMRSTMFCEGHGCSVSSQRRASSVNALLHGRVSAKHNSLEPIADRYARTPRQRSRHRPIVIHTLAHSHSAKEMLPPLEWIPIHPRMLGWPHPSQKPSVGTSAQCWVMKGSRT